MALTSEPCMKTLPKNVNGEVLQFKGWPKLQWFLTDNLARPPRDWDPPGRLLNESPAYIEYTADRDGSVMGVTVSRSAMINHCRALKAACGYTEGEVMVCVVDFKRDLGLWHAVLAVSDSFMWIVRVCTMLFHFNSRNRIFISKILA